MTKDAQHSVLIDVALERDNQDRKWGGPENDDQIPLQGWCDLIQHHAGSARTMVGIESLDMYRKRMIQVAALAVAAVESLDRKLEDSDHD